MRSVLLSVCVISAVSMAFSACSDDTSSPASGGDSGAAGEPSAAGAAGTSDAAGAAGAAGASCDATGTGSLQFELVGLPAGATAAISVYGPHPVKFDPSNSYDDISSGDYTFRAPRVYDTDPIVRTAYDPTSIGEQAFCLPAGTHHVVTVTYAAIPTSNKLWSLNDNGTAGILGFASSKLGATQTAAASVAADAPGGQSLAFDYDGNLWTGPATVGDPVLARYSAASLAASGKPTAELAFNVPAIDCVPALKGIALDPQGNMWLSTCGKQLLEIPKSAFATPTGADAEDVAPSATLSGFTANEDLSFDNVGNLWVADDGKIERFNLMRLGADDSAPADLTLSVTTDDATPKALAANYLAFDAHGNLWALDFAANGVFEIPKASLAGSGTHSIVSTSHLVVDVQAVLARPAFDDGGSLWLPLAQGKFGKLTPALLGVNTDAGSPTTPAIVISSSDVGSADGFAFYPAAPGLPLASAQP